MVLCRGKDGFKIDVVRVATIDQSAGRMSDRVHVWVLDRADDSVGDLLTRLPLAIMDCGQHPIGFGENLVRQVHTVFFQDVALDALQHGEVFTEFLVQFVNLLPLRQQTFRIQAASHRHPL